MAAESTIRSRARRQGYTIKKDRSRTENLDHRGGYMIIITRTNSIVAGNRYDLSLADVEDFLRVEPPLGAVADPQT